MGKRLESLQRPSNIVGEGPLDSAPESIDTAPFYTTLLCALGHTHIQVGDSALASKNLWSGIWRPSMRKKASVPGGKLNLTFLATPKAGDIAIIRLSSEGPEEDQHECVKALASWVKLGQIPVFSGRRWSLREGLGAVF